MEKEKKKQTVYDMIKEYLDEVKKLKEDVPSTERPSWDIQACTLEPLSSILVTPREVIITADLPYVQSQSVKVEPINSDRLEVTAEMKRKVKLKELGVFHHEGEFSTFSCQTRIPVPVDMEHMKTTIKRGLLEIRIPRKRSTITAE